MTEEERNIYMYNEKSLKRSSKQYSQENEFGATPFELR